jgi:hypothetical protein
VKQNNSRFSRGITLLAVMPVTIFNGKQVTRGHKELIGRSGQHDGYQNNEIFPPISRKNEKMAHRLSRIVVFDR